MTQQATTKDIENLLNEDYKETMTTQTKIIKDIKDDPSLEQVQKFVGGYVELVSVNDGVLLINEDGKSKHLPINDEASRIYEQAYGVDEDIILGNAIYIPNTLTKSQWFN